MVHLPLSKNLFEHTGEAMTGINQYMTSDHRHCDELFAATESAADNEDWETAATQTEIFLTAMENHFTKEEEVLFPVFEETTGMQQGPTQVMRHEHQQMRDLFSQLRYALEATDQDEFLSITETLLILMQQHNMKEEGILYSMSDEQFGDDTASTVLEKMQKIGD